MQRSSVLLDRFGLSLSGLCLGHCLILPLAAMGLPLAGAWADNRWVHIGFVLIAVPIAGRALVFPKDAKLRRPALIAAGGAGLALLAFGAFGPEAADHEATIAGSLTLALAHGLNWLGHGRERHPC